jgi:small subunit ribosomal protein S16
MGRRHRSFFRLSAIDGRNPRNGRDVEELGWYDPNAKGDEPKMDLKRDRIEYWLGVGAEPTKTVADLLKKQGFTVKNNVK